MSLFTKTLKRLGIAFLVLVLILYCLFWSFSAPKSDLQIVKTFKKSEYTPLISYHRFKGFDYRKLTVKKDTTLPTIVFVHGTIGSSTDFSKYMKDSLLLSEVNMISYDRVGYNYNDKTPVQESIAFESAMLQDILKDLKPEKTIVVGYSYGGPIALALKQKVHKVILLAPAVYSKVEPMPWMLHFYKWKLTRWLIPPVWQQASKEKLSHKQDLQRFENNWKSTPNTVVSIHGTNDWIVPIENSTFLEQQFTTNQFKLIRIPDAGHGFIWRKFGTIKQLLINELN